MPIPPFTSQGVLPPHAGDPRSPAGLSPYRVTIVEVCQRWNFSPERKTILEGFLRLREALRANGIVDGFQWLDGSFVEQVEATRGRPPKDIDVVTFYMPPSPPTPSGAASLPILNNHDATKAHFHVDHFLVPLGQHPALTVDTVRYWTGLFSHRKGDGLWKGMLRIDLADVTGDAASRAVLTASGVTP